MARVSEKIRQDFSAERNKDTGVVPGILTSFGRHLSLEEIFHSWMERLGCLNENSRDIEGVYNYESFVKKLGLEGLVSPDDMRDIVKGRAGCGVDLSHYLCHRFNEVASYGNQDQIVKSPLSFKAYLSFARGGRVDRVVEIDVFPRIEINTQHDLTSASVDKPENNEYYRLVKKWVGKIAEKADRTNEEIFSFICDSTNLHPWALLGFTPPIGISSEKVCEDVARAIAGVAEELALSYWTDLFGELAEVGKKHFAAIGNEIKIDALLDYLIKKQLETAKDNPEAFRKQWGDLARLLKNNAQQTTPMIVKKIMQIREKTRKGHGVNKNVGRSSVYAWLTGKIHPRCSITIWEFGKALGLDDEACIKFYDLANIERIVTNEDIKLHPEEYVKYHRRLRANAQSFGDWLSVIFHEYSILDYANSATHDTNNKMRASTLLRQLYVGGVPKGQSFITLLRKLHEHGVASDDMILLLEVWIEGTVKSRGGYHSIRKVAEFVEGELNLDWKLKPRTFSLEPSDSFRTCLKKTMEAYYLAYSSRVEKNKLPNPERMKNYIRALVKVGAKEEHLIEILDRWVNEAAGKAPNRRFVSVMARLVKDELNITIWQPKPLDITIEDDGSLGTCLRNIMHAYHITTVCDLTRASVFNNTSGKMCPSGRVMKKYLTAFKKAGVENEHIKTFLDAWVREAVSNQKIRGSIPEVVELANNEFEINWQLKLQDPKLKTNDLFGDCLKKILHAYYIVDTGVSSNYVDKNASGVLPGTTVMKKYLTAFKEAGVENEHVKTFLDAWVREAVSNQKIRGSIPEVAGFAREELSLDWQPQPQDPKLKTNDRFGDCLKKILCAYHIVDTGVNNHSVGCNISGTLPNTKTMEQYLAAFKEAGVENEHVKTFLNSWVREAEDNWLIRGSISEVVEFANNKFEIDWQPQTPPQTTWARKVSTPSSDITSSAVPEKS